MEIASSFGPNERQIKGYFGIPLQEVLNMSMHVNYLSVLDHDPGVMEAAKTPPDKSLIVV